VTVNVSVLLTPLSVAVMVTLALAATPSVVTVKVPVVAPAATVIVVGTVAALMLLLARETTVPPVPAGALSVTVPVTGLPPTMLVAPKVMFERTAGLMVKVPVCTPL
jgi:hypothetical protein